MTGIRSFIFISMLFILVLKTPGQDLFESTSGKSDAIVVEGDTLKPKNPTGAMLRSIVVPGWGQFYNGKWFKGLVIAGAEIGLVANAVVLNQWANQAETEEEYLFYIDNRNLSFWLLGATILYSMADAFVDAHLADFDESPDLSLRIYRQRDLIVGDSATIVSLRYSCHF